MIGDPYATIEELEQFLGIEDDGSFGRLLDAASREVEAFAGRQFNKDDSDTPEATERRFRALDPWRLPVDDFHTLEDLEVDGYEEDQIDPRPPDGIVGGQVGWPFSDIYAVGRTFPPSRRATIEVTAHWGWASVPAGIVQSTLEVAQGLKLGVDSGVIKSEMLGDHQKTYWSPDVTGELYGFSPEFKSAAPYRRKRFGVA